MRSGCFGVLIIGLLCAAAAIMGLVFVAGAAWGDSIDPFYTYGQSYAREGTGSAIFDYALRTTSPWGFTMSASDGDSSIVASVASRLILRV